MNVLLTSVGRRTYLINYFKEALKPFGGKLFAINSDEESPALWLADNFEKSPLIYDSSYESFLFDFCLRYKIDLVIPLFDIDLPVLSGMKNRFQMLGTRVIVGDLWLTQMSNDKLATQDFLRSHGFDTVPTFVTIEDVVSALESDELSYPFYIKPRWGMGSMALYQVTARNELEVLYERVKKEIKSTYLRYESEFDINKSVLIQSLMPGAEYGLDIINDLKGNYCTTIVKKKISMRSGETDVAEVVYEPKLSLLGEKLSKITKHPGIMDVDVFFDDSSAFILELNPRFGGGYPFSHVAGVRLPEAILSWHTCDKGDIVDRYLTGLVGVKSAKGVEIIVKED